MSSVYKLSNGVNTYTFEPQDGKVIIVQKFGIDGITPLLVTKTPIIETARKIWDQLITLGYE